MLHPPGNRRERILVYGQSKQGKSTGWMDVAEWIFRTKSTAKIWLGDTDVAWEAMRPIDGHLDAIVQHRDLFEWPSYKDWIKEATAKANRNREDWLVIDMVDQVYEKAKGEYYFRAYGKELDEFFIDAKGDSTVIGGAYGTNWDVINKMYNSVMEGVHRFPGHVYAATPATQVREPNRQGTGGDSIDVRSMFGGKIGFKPKGQAQLPHLFHSILYAQKLPVERGADKYMLTTVGDRQRKMLVGEVVGMQDQPPQFVQKYLIGVAGWRP